MCMYIHTHDYSSVAVRFHKKNLSLFCSPFSIFFFLGVRRYRRIRRTRLGARVLLQTSVRKLFFFINILYSSDKIPTIKLISSNGETSDTAMPRRKIIRGSKKSDYRFVFRLANTASLFGADVTSRP